VGDIPPGEAMSVEVDGEEVALFNLESEVNGLILQFRVKAAA
jgi:hypothetical protein